MQVVDEQRWTKYMVHATPIQMYGECFMITTIQADS